MRGECRGTSDLTIAELAACLSFVLRIARARLHFQMLDCLKSLPLSWGDGFIVFFALAIGHAFADFAWQSQFMATNKNRHLVPKDTDTGKASSMWIHVLSGHCLVHAGVVWIVLGSLKLVWLVALIEFIAHWIIDFVKCDGKTSFNQDQGLHYFCKAAYTVAIVLGWLH